MRRFLLVTGLVLAGLGSLAALGVALSLLPRARADRAARVVLRESEARAGKGDRRGAREKLDEALRLSPEFPDAHRSLGMVLLAEGKVEEGAEELRRSAEAQPFEPGIAWETAFAFSAAQRPADAVTWFRRVADLERNNGAARAMLAEAYLQLGKPEEAERWAEAGVKVSPRLPLTHFTLGFVRWQAGHLETARAAFEGALQLRPGDARTLLALAAVAGQMDRMDLAEGYLQRALRVRPGDAVAWTALATTQAQLGKRQEARAGFLQALRLDPGNAAAKAGLARLGGE
jgi:tetratricopeptide (TPR) repeat protein